jgi:DNA-binding MarR family transcriptional regulator
MRSPLSGGLATCCSPISITSWCAEIKRRRWPLIRFGDLKLDMRKSVLTVEGAEYEEVLRPEIARTMKELMTHSFVPTEEAAARLFAGRSEHRFRTALTNVRKALARLDSRVKLMKSVSRGIGDAVRGYWLQTSDVDESSPNRTVVMRGKQRIVKSVLTDKQQAFLDYWLEHPDYSFRQLGERFGVDATTANHIGKRIIFKGHGEEVNRRRNLVKATKLSKLEAEVLAVIRAKPGQLRTDIAHAVGRRVASEINRQMERLIEKGYVHRHVRRNPVYPVERSGVDEG